MAGADFGRNRSAGRTRRTAGEALLPRHLEGVRRGGGRLPRRAQGDCHARRARRGGAGRRGARCLAQRPPGRDLHRHGPVGLRQVHAAALPLAADRADRRQRRVRRQGSAQGERGGAHRHPPPQDGHGVPELCPAAAPDRAGERRLSARDPGHRARRTRRPGARDDRARRACGAAKASTRMRFRAASSSASASRAASRSSRRSGSSTSRSPRSTR